MKKNATAAKAGCNARHKCTKPTSDRCTDRKANAEEHARGIRYVIEIDGTPAISIHKGCEVEREGWNFGPGKEYTLSGNVLAELKLILCNGPRVLTQYDIETLLGDLCQGWDTLGRCLFMALSRLPDANACPGNVATLFESVKQRVMTGKVKADLSTIDNHGAASVLYMGTKARRPCGA